MSLVVVAGALANKLASGGEAWVRLSWVLGFRKLGCRIFFVEEIQPQTCVDATGTACEFERCVNLTYFKQVVDQFGLAGSAALIYDGGKEVHGPAWQELLDLATSADLLVNISGHLAYPELLRRFRRKAYIDIDPGFTQFWHAQGNAGARLAGHDYYFTIGENVGTPGCDIPTGGLRWRRTRQPVVLEEWPAVPPSSTAEGRRFTTVASWRGPFGPLQAAGKTYGLKVHEFRRFIELPGRTPQTFEIALDIHPADHKDMDALRRGGWRLVDPKVVAGDPSAFRAYVQNSGAEFSVAQGIYVETHSGWFSDRSVRYLASGKPILVQDTGFGRNVPVGEGLLTFRTLEEAAAGAASIQRDYEKHCAAARALAEQHFDSDMVLRRLLEELGIGA